VEYTAVGRSGKRLQHPLKIDLNWKNVALAALGGSDFAAGPTTTVPLVHNLKPL
jgi:hypothetical protein